MKTFIIFGLVGLSIGLSLSTCFLLNDLHEANKRIETFIAIESDYIRIPSETVEYHTALINGDVKYFITPKDTLYYQIW